MVTTRPDALFVFSYPPLAIKKEDPIALPIRRHELTQRLRRCAPLLVRADAGGCCSHHDDIEFPHLLVDLIGRQSDVSVIVHAAPAVGIP